MPDLGLESYGYGANTGDPAGFWREGQLKRENMQLSNALQKMQNQLQQKQIQEAPQIAAARLSALTSQQPPAFQNPSVAPAPYPGTQSMPNAPVPTAQAMPQNIAPPQAGAPAPGGVSRMEPPPMQAPAAQPAQPQATQGAQAPSIGGGMTLDQMASTIQRLNPSASPEVIMGALDANYKLLNDTGRQQLEYLKLQMQQAMLPIRQQNANTAAGREGVYASRAGMDYAKNFNPTGAPPAPPPGPVGMGAQGTSAGSAANAATPMAQPVSASSLAPPATGGSYTSGQGNIANVKESAKDQGKANALFMNTTLPQIEQGLASVDQARKAFADTDAFRSGGLAPEKRAYLAGVLSQLFGGKEDTKAALTAQLQQKSAAELLINQIGTQPGQQRQTDALRGMIQAAKMDTSKIPEANAALADSIEALLERKRLEGEFKADWSSGPGNGLFDRAGRRAMEDAFEANPLVTFGKSGIPTYNKANVKKVRDTLDAAFRGGAAPVSSGSEDSQRELTPEEMEEYRQLGGQ